MHALFDLAYKQFKSTFSFLVILGLISGVSASRVKKVALINLQEREEIGAATDYEYDSYLARCRDALWSYHLGGGIERGLQIQWNRGTVKSSPYAIPFSNLIASDPELHSCFKFEGEREKLFTYDINLGGLAEPISLNWYGLFLFWPVALVAAFTLYRWQYVSMFASDSGRQLDAETGRQLRFADVLVSLAFIVLTLFTAHSYSMPSSFSLIDLFSVSLACYFALLISILALKSRYRYVESKIGTIDRGWPEGLRLHARVIRALEVSCSRIADRRSWFLATGAAAVLLALILPGYSTGANENYRTYTLFSGSSFDDWFSYLLPLPFVASLIILSSIALYRRHSVRKALRRTAWLLLCPGFAFLTLLGSRFAIPWGGGSGGWLLFSQGPPPNLRGPLYYYPGFLHGLARVIWSADVSKQAFWIVPEIALSIILLLPLLAELAMFHKRSRFLSRLSHFLYVLHSHVVILLCSVMAMASILGLGCLHWGGAVFFVGGGACLLALGDYFSHL